jgi:transposase
MPVVLDNDATHTHAKVQAWPVRHPRVQLHFTPTYRSWLNLVEVFLAIIEHQALRRGDFASVEELMAAIRRFCDGWNQLSSLHLDQGRRPDPGQAQASNTSATGH